MQSLVGLTQLFEGRFEEGLVLDSLSGAQGGQAVEANVYAYGCRALFRLLIWHFDHDAHKPPLAGLCNACTGDLPLEAQGLRQIDPSELGNPKAMIAKLELIVCKVKGRF